MTTLIYKTYEEFEKRENKDLNGFNELFAKDVDFERMNISNKGCWNCVDCEDCVDCNYCKQCYDCTDCKYSKNCQDCEGCTLCEDCRDCKNCKSCYDCSLCTDCLYSEERHDDNQMNDAAEPETESSSEESGIDSDFESEPE
jgi:hypothetical protein